MKKYVVLLVVVLLLPHVIGVDEAPLFDALDFGDQNTLERESTVKCVVSDFKLGSNKPWVCYWTDVSGDVLSTLMEGGSIFTEAEVGGSNAVIASESLPLEYKLSVSTVQGKNIKWETVEFYFDSVEGLEKEYVFTGNCKILFDEQGLLDEVVAVDDTCVATFDSYLLGVGDLSAALRRSGTVVFDVEKGTADITKITTYAFTEFTEDGAACSREATDTGEAVDLRLNVGTIPDGTVGYNTLMITSLAENNPVSFLGIPTVLQEGDSVSITSGEETTSVNVALDGKTGGPRDFAFSEDRALAEKGVANGYCRLLGDFENVADGGQISFEKTSASCADQATCALTSYVLSNDPQSTGNVYSCDVGHDPVFFRALRGGFTDLKCDRTSPEAVNSQISCAEGEDCVSSRREEFVVLDSEDNELIQGIAGLAYIKSFDEQGKVYNFAADFFSIGGSFTSFEALGQTFTESRAPDYYFLTNGLGQQAGTVELTAETVGGKQTYTLEPGVPVVYVVHDTGRLAAIFPFYPVTYEAVSDTGETVSGAKYADLMKEQCKDPSQVCEGYVPGVAQVALGDPSRRGLFSAQGPAAVSVIALPEETLVADTVGTLTDVKADGSAEEIISSGSEERESGTYVVKPGDWISKIAMEHIGIGEGRTYMDVYMEKADELGYVDYAGNTWKSLSDDEQSTLWNSLSDAERAAVWQELPSARTYVVVEDTKLVILRNFDIIENPSTAIDALFDGSYNQIEPGQTLQIPVKAFTQASIKRYLPAIAGLPTLGERAVAEAVPEEEPGEAVRIIFEEGAYTETELDAQFDILESYEPTLDDPASFQGLFENCEEVGKIAEEGDTYYNVCATSTKGTLVHKYVAYIEEGTVKGTRYPEIKRLAEPEALEGALAILEEAIPSVSPEAALALSAPAVPLLAAPAVSATGITEAELDSEFDSLAEHELRFEELETFEVFSNCEDVGKENIDGDIYYKVCQTSQGTLVHKYAVVEESPGVFVGSRFEEIKALGEAEAVATTTLERDKAYFDANFLALPDIDAVLSQQEREQRTEQILLGNLRCEDVKESERDEEYYLVCQTGDGTKTISKVSIEEGTFIIEETRLYEAPEVCTGTEEEARERAPARAPDTGCGAGYFSPDFGGSYMCDKAGLSACFDSVNTHYDGCKGGDTGGASDEATCCSEGLLRQDLCKRGYISGCGTAFIPLSPGPVCEGAELAIPTFTARPEPTSYACSEECTLEEEAIYNLYRYSAKSTPGAPDGIYFTVNLESGVEDAVDEGKITLVGHFSGKNVYLNYCTEGYQIYCKNSGAFLNDAEDVADYSFTEQLGDQWDDLLGALGA